VMVNDEHRLNIDQPEKVDALIEELRAL